MASHFRASHRGIDYLRMLATAQTSFVSKRADKAALRSAKAQARPRRAAVSVHASQQAAASGTAVKRAFNFAAGPAILPVDVLEEAQKDLISWKGCGMSVMEMSHRGKEFESIIFKAEKDLRTLMKIPDNYKVGHPNSVETYPFGPISVLPRAPLSPAYARENAGSVRPGRRFHAVRRAAAQLRC